MLRQIVYLLLVLCGVKSFDLRGSKWKDASNNTISPSYCDTKNCLVKCCPDDHMIISRKGKTSCFKPKLPNLKKKLKSDVNVYKWDYVSNKPVNTGKTLNSHFTFVENDFLLDPVKTIPFTGCEFYILEDGSLRVNYTPDKPCFDTKRLEFCVGFVYMKASVNGGPPVADVVFSYRALRDDDPDAVKKHGFASIGMLISSFFMVLVLAVYGVLRKLRNIVGMILMAYVFTLSIAYVMQSAQLIALVQYSIDERTCQLLSPATYYFMVASFFWLNIMSFDLWWTIRGTRKRRDIHRRGELVKFMWYGLYAWGTPALLTTSVVYVDRHHLYPNNDSKPPFRSCFAERRGTVLYTHIPIGIMTAVNVILFFLTAYNIWLVKRAMGQCKDSRNTKPSENRFIIYIKVFLLMGGSWVLELLPSDQTFWLHVVINFYNVFVGVAIFIIFVCKKSIIIMLCKKYNIRNGFVDGLQASQYSKSATKSSSSKYSRRSLRKDDEVAEDLTTFSTTADAA